MDTLGLQHVDPGRLLFDKICNPAEGGFGQVKKAYLFPLGSKPDKELIHDKDVKVVAVKELKINTSGNLDLLTKVSRWAVDGSFC